MRNVTLKSKLAFFDYVNRLLLNYLVSHSFSNYIFKGHKVGFSCLNKKRVFIASID